MSVGFDIRIHDRYATDVEAFTSFLKQHPLYGKPEGLGSWILNVVATYSATTLLFQAQRKIRFAGIMMPLAYLTWHTFSPFLVPSLSTNDFLDSQIQKIRTRVKEIKSEMSEKEGAALEDESEVLVRALYAIKETNNLTNQVAATLNQFLHA